MVRQKGRLFGMKNSKRNLLTAAKLSLLLLPGAACCQMARADEGADWRAMQAMEKTLPKAERDAEAHIAGYRQFLTASKPGVIVGCTALYHIADAQREQKKYDEAIATCRQGFDGYPNDPATVIVLAPMLRALRDSGKGAQVAQAPATYWPLLVAASRSGHPVSLAHASVSLREMAGAQGDFIADAKAGAEEREAMKSQRVLMLQRALLEMPAYLDDRTQGYYAGWMQDALIDALGSEAKTRKDMLGWAKVFFMTSLFEAKAIERATSGLSKAWAANDNFAAVRAFAKAQDEPKAGEAPVTNPVARIPAPAVMPENAKFLGERVAYLSGLPGYDRWRSSELVGLYLVQAAISSSGKVEGGKTQRTEEEKAALSAAMDNAKKLMGERPEDPLGMEQVCRVFKAVDGGTRRANAFIAYLNGTGENPLPVFADEMK